MTWVLVALGSAGAALGLPAALHSGVWATTAGGLLIAVGSLPRLWGGLGRPTSRRPAPTVHLMLWNLAMAGVVALTCIGLSATSADLTRVGMALYLLAAAALLITVDSAEVRLRRGSASAAL